MNKSKRYTYDYKEIIVDLSKSRMTITELSSEYGITKSTISGWIKGLKEIKINADKVMTVIEGFSFKKLNQKEIRKIRN